MRRHTRRQCARALLPCALLIAAPAFASGPVTLTASDAGAGDNFGSSVALDGDTLIVGAPLAGGPAGVAQGAAYVYRWNGSGWTEEAILTVIDAAPVDQFGSTVALNGDTALVGAQFDNGAAGVDQGSAYVFTRSGTAWTQQAKLLAADGAASDFFGSSVALDGDTALVGAHLDDDAAGSDQGSAYVFTRSGSSWTQQAKLTAADAAAGDFFGFSVALDGDTALVGAGRDDGAAGPEQGSAYVFTRTGSSWAQQAKLTAADGAEFDRFGFLVALDGDTALIGARLDDGAAGADQGSAYVFIRSGSSWAQQAKLTAADASPGDFFGNAVALDGGTALVGSRRDDGAAGADQGSVYVFTSSGTSWTQQAVLTASNAAAGDEFGFPVALDGDTALVGARLDDGAAGADQGSAHVFTRIGPVWVGPDQKVADGAAGDRFGSSVAIDGDTALVGAHFGGGAADPDQGSVYVFTRSGTAWTQQARLTANDGAADDLFGSSVALDGDTALVGAHLDDGGAGADQGSVYVFTRSGSLWTQQWKLTAADPGAGDFFGISVALDGDTALVGAGRDDNVWGADAGSAYIFTRSDSSWSQQGKIFAADRNTGARFGFPVALDGDTALIGARLEVVAPGGVNHGAAYVFRFDPRIGRWTQEARLTAADAAAGDLFGNAVALDGDTALVGARFGDDVWSDVGTAYVFNRVGSSWTQQAKLTAAVPRADDLFGCSVALHGDTALVGAYRDDDVLAGRYDQGAAYVFKRSGAMWTQQAKRTAPDAAAGDFFGFSVALDGDTALIGAERDDDAAGPDQGSAWFSWIGEESLPALVHNVTRGTIHGSLRAAISNAASSDAIIASASAFLETEPTDYYGKVLSITSGRGVRRPYLNTVTLADGGSLNAAAGMPMTLFGGLSVPETLQPAGATLRADAFRLGAGGDLTVGAGAALTLDAAGARLQGDMLVLSGATAAFTGDAVVEGELTLAAGTLSAPLLTIDFGGRFVGDGDLITSVVNRADFTTIENAVISGDLTNEDSGTVAVQIGTLAVLGSLINDGTIVGDLQTSRAATQPGDGLSVGADYHAGPDALLLMSSDLWRVSVGADFDVAINSNSRYDMAQAELRIGAGAPSAIERMSTDIGPSPDGLDRTLTGHYPIGTLRITGGAATLVDTHDNDNLGQAACEAIYVRHLVIDAGATLNTNGCTVYYETLILNGSVDDPANLIQIAQCEADFNGDGVVDGADLGVLLGSWGLPGTDLNADGVTDGADLGLLLGAWGACP